MKLETLQKIVKDKRFLGFIGVSILIAFIVIMTFISKRPETTTGTGIEPERRPTNVDIRVLRVEPLPDTKNISTSPTIKISFEQSIKDKKISITAVPKIVFDQSLSSGGYRLMLTPKEPLKTSTKYTLVILADKTKIYSWSFTTGEKIVDPAVINAIKSLLPYKGDHFTISYAQASDRFYVIIDKKPMEIYKKAALDWFASQGLLNAENTVNIFYYAVGEALD